VAESAQPASLAEADGLTGTLAWSVAAERGPAAGAEIAIKHVLAAASQQPGHLFEATAARIFAWLGRPLRQLPNSNVLPWELWRQNFIQTASEQLAVIEIDGDHQMPPTAPDSWPTPYTMPRSRQHRDHA
jgi:hypothetical protein